MKGNNLADTLVKLVDYPNIADTIYQHSQSNFTVPSNGIYYIGFHAYSAPDMWQLIIDDVTLAQASGINEATTLSNLSIFPNPVKNELNITSTASLKNVKIINAIGQEIMNENVSGNHYRINTSSYNKGIYFVQIESEKGKTTKKFIVSE